jgi:hypothetical protein
MCSSSFCDPFAYLSFKYDDEETERKLNADFGGFYVIEKPMMTKDKKKKGIHKLCFPTDYKPWVEAIPMFPPPKPEVSC